jgi:ATP-dependent DNA helicase PIF1
VSRQAALYRNLDTIIIDEVSMIRADLMDGIDYFLRINRARPGEPFGGVRVILIGDVHQLPPVVSDQELRPYLDHTYGGAFFFNAPVFKQMPLQYVELTKKFRQSEVAFCEALDSISEGACVPEHLALLNRNLADFEQLPERDEYIILAPHNQTVFDFNMDCLARLPTPERIFAADVRGQFEESSFPTDHTLRLKVGAKVVVLRNDPDKRWVNGTMGIVSRLANDKIWLLINGVEREIERETWEKIRYEFDHARKSIVQTVVGSFRQFPVRLAWALTIHKSQGMTLERVYLDLARGAFAHGQTYVALSRCRSLDGLALARQLRPDDVIFDHAAVGYRNIFEPVP